MKVWNVSNKDIFKTYNSVSYKIPANSVTELTDDLVVFLLSKREVIGQGLVQYRDGDNKIENYKIARLNMYNWATEKWGDYLKHCEERESQSLLKLAPHKEVLVFKAIIDDYDKWSVEGFPMPKDLEDLKTDDKVYVCPVCGKEFDSKNLYMAHYNSIHLSNKEEVSVDIGTIKNKSKV